MSYLLAQKDLLSADLKKLIASATEFEENSEECIAFENYVWSTIMHYEYPSVDKTSVKSKFNLFVEKFKIHANYFPQKAKNLEMLLEHCLKLNCYKEDVLWNMLNLLLLLSKHPTESTEDDLPLKFPLYEPKQEKEESFDWGAYLKEGLPDYRLPSEDSSSEDEESDLRSTKEALTQATKEILKRHKPINSTGIENTFDSFMNTIVPFQNSINSSIDSTILNEQNTTNTSILRSNEEVDDVKSKEFSEEELKSALLIKESFEKNNQNWWRDPTSREQCCSKMPVPNACLTWEQKMSNNGVIVGETRIISEFKAMKELISALYFPGNYFILRKLKDGYKPTEKVSICSSNPIDFYNTINLICPYLTVIENIDKFLECIDVSSLGVSRCNNVPYTYVAYASALKHMMNQFRNFLSIIEAHITEKKQIYLLSDLLIETLPWLKHINHVYNVHTKAIDSNWKKVDNWICASRLLAVLYDSLENSNGWDKIDLTLIFIKSLTPYIEILDTWLTHYKYDDTHEEFLIKRPSKISCEGNLYIQDYKTHLASLNLKDSLFLDNFVYYSIRACSSIDFQIILQKNAFDKQKSEVETPFILEYLDSFINDLPQNTSTLPYINFIKKKCLDLNSRSEPTQNEVKLPSNCFNKYDLVENNCSIWNEFKSFMELNQIKDAYCDSDSHKISEYLNKLENIDIDSIDVSRLLKEHFSIIISNRMQPKGFARDTLLNDYKLLDHLNVLKSIYLCLDGVKISIFSKILFTKVFVNGLKSISLTNELRELLYKDYPMYYSNFIVTSGSKELRFETIKNLHSSYPDFISYSHELRVQYLLEVPLNLVITAESIDKYNEIFNFLLKTKWAMYLLCSLSFSDLNDGTKGTLVPRLISLRMFLLHNVLTFEKYFIAINSEDFDDEITNVCSVARDIHVIANAHDRFLNQKRKHCFLFGSPKIYSSILTIFEICQIFNVLWKSSIKANLESNISNVLLDLELKYQNCMIELADALLLLGRDYFFKNNINFSYLCDELFNNMPGNWE